MMDNVIRRKMGPLARSGCTTNERRSCDWCRAKYPRSLTEFDYDVFKCCSDVCVKSMRKYMEASR